MALSWNMGSGCENQSEELKELLLIADWRLPMGLHQPKLFSSENPIWKLRNTLKVRFISLQCSPKIQMLVFTRGPLNKKVKGLDFWTYFDIWKIETCVIRNQNVRVCLLLHLRVEPHTLMIDPGPEKEGGWFWLNLHKKHSARPPSFAQVSKCNSQFSGHHLWITFRMCNALHQTVLTIYYIDHSWGPLSKWRIVVFSVWSVTQ